MAKIDEALKFHLEGQLTVAERMYLEILAKEPEHPDANHLLAALYHSKGEYKKALGHANHAVAASRSAQFLNTRGMIFVDSGYFNEATSDLRAAIKLAPDVPEAHNNLSIAYKNLGDLRKAKLHAEKSLELKPDFPQGWLSLGAVQQDSGHLEEALASYQRALEFMPGQPVALENIAKINYQLQRFDVALEGFLSVKASRALDLSAAFACAHIFLEQGNYQEACEVLEQSFATNSEWKGLAGLLEQTAFFGVLYKICGYLAGVIGQPGRAVALYDMAIKHAPNVAHAIWVNKAKIYFDIHRIDDAIHCNEQALDAVPRSPMSEAWAYNNMGVCYIVKKESQKAIDCFQKAHEIVPDFAPALGWLLNEKTHYCDWADFSEIRSKVQKLRFTDNTTTISPFVALSVFTDPEDLLYWAKLSGHELFDETAKQASIEPPKPKQKREKIRIGYYSFDFRNHPVAHLTARLFEVHDHDKFDIYAYSYGPDDGSAVRDRIKANVKQFVDVKDLSVIDTAKRIAEDDLDILIDLTGNTLHNRSQVFALRPARVQAHWLGFIGTMGSKYYDYIIADEIVAPVEDERFFVEGILRIPGGLHVMDDTRVIDSSRQTRQANGLPENAFVFGCFCQTLKIQPEIFGVWMRILKEVPNSVLWLASGPEGAIDNLKKYASEQGVEPSRLMVAERCSMDEYLTRFALIDLYLDTFPYTSGTVASDALYAGCPLLTLSGKTMVSRMAGSILTHAGFPELVTYDEGAYMRQAIDLARDKDQVTKIRTALLQLRNNGELLNTKKIVDGYEKQLLSVL